MVLDDSQLLHDSLDTIACREEVQDFAQCAAHGNEIKFVREAANQSTVVIKHTPLTENPADSLVKTFVAESFEMLQSGPSIRELKLCSKGLVECISVQSFLRGRLVHEFVKN